MQHFNDGLGQLAQSAELGAYILAMANASFDVQVYQQLLPQLQQAFMAWETRFSDPQLVAELAKKNTEDVSVFQQLLSLGFDQLQVTQQRQLDPWEVQFNHLRSFRPTRMSQQKIDSLHQAFDPQGFHFNKPFLAKEQLWQGTLAGMDVTLFYNKYPFVTAHALLVPQPSQQLPQYLTREQHLQMWRILAELESGIPAAGLGYNSRGAFASVNHLHFQFFIREQPLPIQDARWCHNGGTEQYPLRCEVFTSAAAGWDFIERLHQRNIAYNLLYFPGKLYCVPRRMQGHYQPADWNGAFTWYEVAGGQITFSEQQFTQLESRQLAAEFAKLQIDV